MVIHFTSIVQKKCREMLQKPGMMSDKCDEWSLPLIAMMYRGENIKKPHEPDIVAHAARVGAEAGADIVKTLYTGDPVYSNEWSEAVCPNSYRWWTQGQDPTEKSWRCAVGQCQRVQRA